MRTRGATSSLLWPAAWYFLAHALNCGAATIPQGQTLLAWLDSPVTDDNPDDVIAVSKVQDPVLYRLGPKGHRLDLTGPFTAAGAHEMARGFSVRPARFVSTVTPAVVEQNALQARCSCATGLRGPPGAANIQYPSVAAARPLRLLAPDVDHPDAESKEKLSFYGIRKHVLDAHFSQFGETATKLLAGHSQRSHTLKSNYIRDGSRISLTTGATDEDAPVVPATAASSR